MEEWRDIEGYEGLYQVSNIGRIKSLAHVIKANISGGIRCTNEHIKRTNKGWHGYHYVALCKDGVSKTRSVHRIVAIAFIPNENNYPAVNHIDGNKDNNSADNLEWCSNAYNSAHAVKMGLITRAKKVRCVNTGIIYRCSKDAELATGINGRNIRSACSGIYKSAGGYKWEWV